MKAVVIVRQKDDVPDSAGLAIKRQLLEQGISDVKSIRIGKIIELDMDIGDDMAIRERVKRLCSELLVNEVSEEYSLRIEE